MATDKKNNSKKTPEEQAVFQSIKHRFDAGDNLADISKDCGVPVGTLAGWKSHYIRKARKELIQTLRGTGQAHLNIDHVNLLSEEKAKEIVRERYLAGVQAISGIGKGRGRVLSRMEKVLVRSSRELEKIVSRGYTIKAHVDGNFKVPFNPTDIKYILDALNTIRKEAAVLYSLPLNDKPIEIKTESKMQALHLHSYGIAGTTPQQAIDTIEAIEIKETEAMEDQLTDWQRKLLEE